MDNPFKVRLATQEDIDKIVRLAEEWHDGAIDCKIRKETLKETLSKEGHEIFVAIKDEKIIGWFDIRAYLDWFLLRYSVHVEHIFVTSAYCKKGVGSLILAKIMEHYRKLGEQSNMLVMFFYSEGIVDRFFTKNRFTITRQHFFVRKELINRKQ